MARIGSDSFIAELGQVIRKHREAAGLTLEDLAYQSDMTSRHLFQIEKARTNPKVDTLYEIAGALGVKLSDLIRDAERQRTKRT